MSGPEHTQSGAGPAEPCSKSPRPDELAALARLVQRVGRQRARRLLAVAGSARAALAGLPDLAEPSATPLALGVRASPGQENNAPIVNPSAGRGRASGVRVPADNSTAGPGADAETERGAGAAGRERPINRPTKGSRDAPSHRLIAQDHPHFPPLLREIPDPPLVLYVAGATELLVRPAIAIVGARRCSRYGETVARRFAEQLASFGLTVVSGLALGIDTAAHHGALLGGRTVAILGGGLARIYPPRNRTLAAEIKDSGGVIVSEHAPEEPPRRHQFPERNRLISGMALGVIVVEAGEQSGSLITARLALEQGREVMAVPGLIDNPLARGCHRLLRQGAALVETAADVMEALGLSMPAPAPSQSGRASEGVSIRPELAALLDRVGLEATTLDALCAATGEPPEWLAERLLELELGGFVEQLAGGYIRRAMFGV